MNSLRMFAVSLLVGLVMWAAPVGAQTAQFLSVIEDLPLMPGLTEETDAAMSFESADGRIAETVARGVMAGTVVKGFYADALPQLGWQPVRDGGFQRGNEHLSVEITEIAGQSVAVRFRLRPSGR